MSTGQILGAALTAAPFIVITAFAVEQGGWVEAVRIWSVTLGLVVMMATGVHLILG